MKDRKDKRKLEIKNDELKEKIKALEEKLSNFKTVDNAETLSFEDNVSFSISI